MLELTATELPRVMQCNGSLLMNDNPFSRDETDTTARDEGIAAHWLGETVIRRGDQIGAYNGLKAPNGIFITSEMINHVAEYTSGVTRGGKFDGVEVETFIQGENFTVNSRADHVNFSDILYIDDFKYGHRIVEVKENWTLIAHAIGFCLNNNVAPDLITFTVYQPRARHGDGTVRNWSVSYDDLAKIYYARLLSTLNNPTNILTTGRQCRRCRSLSHCPAASAAGFSAVEESSLAFDENISNDELSSELDILKEAQDRLQDRHAALEELAKHRLKRGEIINGYAIEQGKGNTAFRKSVTPEMLQALTGKPMTQPAKLMTPAAVRRELNNDALADILFATLTERPSTGVKLKRIDANKQAASLLKG